MTENRLPETTDRDVYITRTFAAPVATVWRFWTDPDLLAQWFGPHHVTVPRDSVVVEAREGGAWNVTMEDESGIHPITATIMAITENEYLEVLLSADTGMGEVEDVYLRVQFHDHGDTTRMTLHQGPFLPEFIDPTKDGWLESFAKIDTLIEGGTR